MMLIKNMRHRFHPVALTRHFSSLLLILYCPFPCFPYLVLSLSLSRVLCPLYLFFLHRYPMLGIHTCQLEGVDHYQIFKNLGLLSSIIIFIYRCSLNLSSLLDQSLIKKTYILPSPILINNPNILLLLTSVKIFPLVSPTINDIPLRGGGGEVIFRWTNDKRDISTFL